MLTAEEEKKVNAIRILLEMACKHSFNRPTGFCLALFMPADPNDGTAMDSVTITNINLDKCPELMRMAATRVEVEGIVQGAAK